MEKLESLEKYVITPNVRFYGGFKYEGKDIELCDDTDKEYIKEEQEDGSIIEKEVASIKVQQRIINSVLITEIEAERKMKNGKKIKEKSHMEIEIEENEGKITCGVGDEHKGYDAPDLPFQYHGGVKLQKPDKGMGGVHKSEKPDNNIGYDNVYHQVGDSEAGVLIAEKIDFSVEPFHWPCQLLFQHT